MYGSEYVVVIRGEHSEQYLKLIGVVFIKTLIDVELRSMMKLQKSVARQSK